MLFRSPGVKSMKELGYNGFDLFNWDGILVRKETPDYIVNEINSKLKETLADQEVIDALKKIGTNTMYLDNTQFDGVIKKELEFYK